MQTNLLEEYQRLQTGESTRAVAYLRLRRALQNLMDAGVLRPGQALPSERDLAQLLDLSRVTIRKALAGLIESGLLVQRQGGLRRDKDVLEEEWLQLSETQEAAGG